MIKNNFHQKKIALFSTYLVVGITYFSLIIYASINLIPEFFYQMWLLGNFQGSINAILQICSSYEFISGIMIGVFSFLLIVNIIKANIQLVFSILRTNISLRGLKYKQSRGINILDNLKNEVFSMGLFNPKIYFSKNLLDELTTQEISAIIKHEEYHVKYKDNLLSLIVKFIYNSLIWFPYKGRLLNTYKVVTELSADEYSINSSGEMNSIISSLTKIIEGKINNNSRLNISSFLPKYNRIDILTNLKKINIVPVLILQIVLLIVMGVFASNTFANHERIMECQVSGTWVTDHIVENSNIVNASYECLQSRFSSSEYCVVK